MLLIVALKMFDIGFMNWHCIWNGIHVIPSHTICSMKHWFLLFFLLLFYCPFFVCLFVDLQSETKAPTINYLQTALLIADQFHPTFRSVKFSALFRILKDLSSMAKNVLVHLSDKYLHLSLFFWSLFHLLLWFLSPPSDTPIGPKSFTNILDAAYHGDLAQVERLILEGQHIDQVLLEFFCSLFDNHLIN